MAKHPSVLEVSRRKDTLEKAIRSGEIRSGDAVTLSENWAFLYKDGPRPVLGMGRSGAAQASQADDDNGTIPFIISVLQEDRDGDIVVPMGCKLHNYAKNPLVFFGHQQWEIPIAQARSPQGEITVWPGPTEIRSLPYFDRGDEDADYIYGKVKRGLLNASSIAFVPIEAYRRDPSREKEIAGKAHPHANPNAPAGWLFKEYDLTEWSIVGVPSNAGAIRDSLDHEKGWITPKLAKAMGVYAAKSKREEGVCFSGWCPRPPLRKSGSGAGLEIRTVSRPNGSVQKKPAFAISNDAGKWWNGNGWAAGDWNAKLFYTRVAAQIELKKIADREFNIESVDDEEMKSLGSHRHKGKDCGCKDCKQGKSCPCEGTIKAEPSDDVSPDKACKILRDGTVNGKPLTEAQRRMFGAACSRAKALSGLSGTDGGYTVPEQTVGNRDCPDCQGTGNCMGCEGDGDLMGEPCPECGGSGECPACMGGPEAANILTQRTDMATNRKTTTKRAPAKKAPAVKKAGRRELLQLASEVAGGRYGSGSNLNEGIILLPKTKLQQIRGWLDANGIDATIQTQGDYVEIRTKSLKKDLTNEGNPEEIKGEEEESPTWRHSAKVGGNLYNHYQSAKDYLAGEMKAMDHPAMKEHFADHDELLSKAMEHIKGGVEGHHPDHDFDKMCKSLLTDGTSGEGEVGEANKVNRGEIPEDDAGSEDFEVAADEDAEAFAGEETPEEEEAEAEVGDEMEMMDGPAEEDPDTEEILERYQDTKSGSWVTIRHKTRLTKSGKRFLIREKANDRYGNELSVGDEVIIGNDSIPWKVDAISGDKVQVSRGSERKTVPAGSVKMNTGGTPNRSQVRPRRDQKALDNEGNPAELKSEDEGGEEMAEVKSSGFTPTHKAILHKAMGHMKALADAPDMPEHHKAGLHYHAKAIEDMVKGLDEEEAKSLTDEGEEQEDGGSGSPLQNEGNPAELKGSKGKKISKAVEDRLNSLTERFFQLTGQHLNGN